MENEFILYEQALELKELGFDEPCFGRYYCKKSYSMLNPNSEETELVFEFGQYIKQTEITILAPLFQQAFRWFREKYQLHSTITSISQESWQWHITKPGESLGKLYDEDFYTYEEAELACLEKLIEIVEQKNEN